MLFLFGGAAARQLMRGMELFNFSVECRFLIKGANVTFSFRRKLRWSELRWCELVLSGLVSDLPVGAGSVSDWRLEEHKHRSREVRLELTPRMCLFK